jgi:hypothetical protein
MMLSLEQRVREDPSIRVWFVYVELRLCVDWAGEKIVNRIEWLIG